MARRLKRGVVHSKTHADIMRLIQKEIKKTNKGTNPETIVEDLRKFETKINKLDDKSEIFQLISNQAYGLPEHIWNAIACDESYSYRIAQLLKMMWDTIWEDAEKKGLIEER